MLFKQWLNNISIRKKIFLFLAIPSVGLLFFIYNSFINERQILNKIEHTSHHLQASFLLSNLITELQKERDRTLGYIEKIGNKEELSLLVLQRQLTDQKIQQFTQSFNKTFHDSDFAHDKLIQKYNLKLAQRVPLQQTKLNKDNSQAYFKYYTEVITQSINLMRNFEKIVDDVHLVHLASAYISLLQLQEQKGQERGLLNGFLKSQEIDSYKFQTISNTASNQEIFRNTFYIEAPEKYAQLLREKLKHPIVKKVENIRKDVLNTFSRLELLNKLQQFIGYGGLIHLFKNYVIRGDPKDLEQFEKKFNQMNNVVQSSVYLNNTSEGEKNLFKHILSTFNLYHNLLTIASHQHRADVDIITINKTVKVNDKMALDAIMQLRSKLTYYDVSNWWQNASFVIKQVYDVNSLLEQAINERLQVMKAQANQKFYLYMALALGTIIITLFMGSLLLNRLVKVTKMSSTMASMLAGATDQYLIIDGNDEISQMALTFNQLIQERSKNEAQLKVALEDAQSAVKAKSDFLSTMSHEIRTPMNGILGMAELLSLTSLNKEQQYYIDTLSNSGQLLLTIINDILDFTKLDARNVELKQEPFNLEKAAFNTLQLLSSQNSKQKIDLIYSYTMGMPHYFIGDQSRLRQILLNLINNAIKFTQDGHILLEITSSQLDEDLYRIKFSVQDTGIGINPENLSKLFDAFTQAEQSTTRQFGGTGLGLAISKQLVELMGGCLQVDSIPGQGSDFYFSLTLPSSQVPPKTLDTRTTDTREILANTYVLVVAHNKLNLSVIQKYLQYYKIETVLLDQATQVMETLRQAQNSSHLFDMILLDENMPDINGIKLAQMIRQEAEFDNTKLLLLTSGDIRSDVEKIHDPVFSSYQSKPVNPEILIQSLLDIKLNKKVSYEPSELTTNINVKEAIGSPPTEEKEQEKKPIPPLYSASVLLAEDNIVNQKVAVAVFKKLNLKVDVANNGEEAVQKCQNKSYDLIFMDCQMPKMDGLEATQLIIKNETAEHTPIIALTANTSQEDKEKCLLAGMDEFVSKPFKKSDISRILDLWLK